MGDEDGQTFADHYDELKRDDDQPSTRGGDDTMENINTGTESPQSATSTLYYKGHSILLTSRDASVDPLPLLQKHIETIEKAIEQYPDIRPSWNVQTNHELAKDADPIKAWDDTRKEVTRETTEDGYKARQEGCAHGSTVQKMSRSEKNPNRPFTACQFCGKFIAWASGS